ncbi:PAC2 family protein, partial [Candidatus Woesearchaeota archaeon]|nr:PAC2 family protein [Candidatus Woesearchaeota archaeon]
TAYKKSIKNLNNNLYGVVGPIIGVSGVLLGLAGKRDIKAVSLLAETYGHPMYLGIKGTKELLKVLNKKLNLKLNFKSITQEIETIDAELGHKILSAADLQRTMALRKSKTKSNNDINYIG